MIEYLLLNNSKTLHDVSKAKKAQISIYVRYFGQIRQLFINIIIILFADYGV